MKTLDNIVKTAQVIAMIGTLGLQLVTLQYVRELRTPSLPKQEVSGDINLRNSSIEVSDVNIELNRVFYDKALNHSQKSYYVNEKNGKIQKIKVIYHDPSGKNPDREYDIQSGDPRFEECEKEVKSTIREYYKDSIRK
jgi:hypothetical protein